MLWGSLLFVLIFLAGILWACIVVGSRSDDRAEEMYRRANTRNAGPAAPNKGRQRQP